MIAESDTLADWFADVPVVPSLGRFALSSGRRVLAGSVVYDMEENDEEFNDEDFDDDFDDDFEDDLDDEYDDDPDGDLDNDLSTDDADLDLDEDAEPAEGFEDDLE
jgi:hypothetical protein